MNPWLVPKTYDSNFNGSSCSCHRAKFPRSPNSSQSRPRSPPRCLRQSDPRDRILLLVAGQIGIERGDSHLVQDHKSKAESAGESDPHPSSVRHTGVHRAAHHGGEQTLPGLAGGLRQPSLDFRCPGIQTQSTKVMAIAANETISTRRISPAATQPIILNPTIE